VAVRLADRADKLASERYPLGEVGGDLLDIARRPRQRHDDLSEKLPFVRAAAMPLDIGVDVRPCAQGKRSRGVEMFERWRDWKASGLKPSERGGCFFVVGHYVGPSCVLMRGLA
jgi:hypothetical protein